MGHTPSTPSCPLPIRHKARVFLMALCFLPPSIWSMYVTDKTLPCGKPHQSAQDAFKRHVDPFTYGYLLPTDPTWGLPRYLSKGRSFGYPKGRVSFDQGVYHFGHISLDRRGNKGFTPQEMADLLMENTLVLKENLRKQLHLRLKILKKMRGPLGSRPSSPEKENTALPEDWNPVLEGVLGARDALSSYVAGYVKSFYDSFRHTLEDMETVLEKVRAAHPKISRKDWESLVQKPLRELRARSVPPLLPSPYPEDKDLKNLEFCTQNMALARYWMEYLSPVLGQLEDFLDTQDLRGKEHSQDYTPPPLDLSRNYWKNHQGQWCSGYGVIFKKDSPGETKSYPLLRPSPLTDATDYSKLNPLELSSNAQQIPQEWFSPRGGWYMLASKKEREEASSGTMVCGTYHKMEEVTLLGSKDLMNQLEIMVQGYLKAYNHEYQNTRFFNGKGEKCYFDWISSETALFGNPLKGYRDQLTQFILQRAGPYYDNLKEMLRAAEKTLEQGKEGMAEEKWRPFFRTLVEGKTPLTFALLSQDTPEKKWAAAHYVREQLLPLEKLWDDFLDGYMFLRGVVYLFPIYNDYEDYGAHLWDNAQGYPCRGFGRLLTPRKPRPTLDRRTYAARYAMDKYPIKPMK